MNHAYVHIDVVDVCVRVFYFLFFYIEIKLFDNLFGQVS